MVDHYTEAFYDRAEQSAAAAAAVVAILRSRAPIGSVVDVGCARGTWLAAWRAAGCEDVIGVDGGYAGRERLLIPTDRFIEADLSRPFHLGRRFDLVQCLEVAEHLPPARSAGLVDDLTAHGGMVLFSAAPPGQGGAHHINEQPYEFWRGLFAARGYTAFDCVRPAIAGRGEIPYWYRYNVLLYVRNGEEVPGLPGRLPDAEPVPDLSPPLFRLRKALFRRLPQPILDRLAALHTRLRSRMEKTPAPSAAGAMTAAGSPDRFGYSWETYAELLPAHEEQFRRWTAPLQAADWRGKAFLDAGCGMGRNSYWPLRDGAARGVAIDLDERTLAGARRTLAEFANAEVRRQSIYEIAEEDTFDIAFSIGVVHHLADPAAAVARLVRAVRPGGLVLLWLYGREGNGWIVWLFNPLRKRLFSRLPLPLVHACSWLLSAVLWLGLRPNLSRSPYLRQIRGFSFRHLRAIVFDHMIPRIALYYSRAEAIALLEAAGLTEVGANWTNQMSWTVTGRKPGDLVGAVGIEPTTS